MSNRFLGDEEEGAAIYKQLKEQIDARSKTKKTGGNSEALDERRGPSSNDVHVDDRSDHENQPPKHRK